MTFPTILVSCTALACALLAAAVMLRAKRSASTVTLAAGLVLLALEAVFQGPVMHGATGADPLQWFRMRALTSLLAANGWLLFIMLYPDRAFSGLSLASRLSLAGPLLLVVIIALSGPTSFFADAYCSETGPECLLILGSLGYFLHLALLLTSVAILVLAERTLRSTIGRTRWKVKLMVFGLGIVFAVRVFTSSQTLLYFAVDTRLAMVDALGSLAGCALMAVSLGRGSLTRLELYPSHAVLHRSLTLLVSGVYLLAVGLIPRLLDAFDTWTILAANAVLFIAGLVGFALLLLSDRFNLRVKRFISRNFKRPRYDYRKIWSETAALTGTVLRPDDLAQPLARLICGNLDLLTVAVWLREPPGEDLLLAASTESATPRGLRLSSHPDWSRHMVHEGLHQSPVDFLAGEALWINAFREANGPAMKTARIRFGIPMVSGEELIGLITLDDRVAETPLEVEDLDLLHAMAEHAAASFHNLLLLDQLRKARELELFQTLSAFFVHDLKNVASKLSLTMQNFSLHHDDPEFREDALRVISESVQKINGLCQGLSALKERPAPRLELTDIKALVEAAARSLNGCTRGETALELAETGNALVDQEQMTSIVTNLILNASDAIDDRGRITVSTRREQGWAVIAVEDNGKGMGKDFLEKQLFQPFKTTKSKGLGIGLYQCKTIAEAHGGRIEVESEEGVGTVVRVYVPLKNWKARACNAKARRTQRKTQKRELEK